MNNDQRYEIEIFLNEGWTKIFTDYEVSDAQTQAFNCAREGFLMTDPNDERIQTLIPAHRIKFIQIRPMVEEQ